MTKILPLEGRGGDEEFNEREIDQLGKAHGLS